MLARAPHVAYTTFLCLFGALGLVPMTLLRVRLGAAALVINLGFVFAMINAQFFWGVGILWIHVRRRSALPCYAPTASPVSCAASHPADLLTSKRLPNQQGAQYFTREHARVEEIRTDLLPTIEMTRNAVPESRHLDGPGLRPRRHRRRVPDAADSGARRHAQDCGRHAARRRRHRLGVRIGAT